MSMDWFPIVFMTFKVVVLGVGMFLAVKWHYDKGKASKASSKPAEREEQSPEAPQ